LSTTGSRLAPRKPLRPALTLENIESRITPVVGAIAVPSPIDPGEGYDGVAVNFGDTGEWQPTSRFTSWIDSRLGGLYRLIVDMNRQPGGNDGDADTIQWRLAGDSATSVDRR
jgi:hypothetical protein